MAAVAAAAQRTGLTPEEIIRQAVTADLLRAGKLPARRTTPRKRGLK